MSLVFFTRLIRTWSNFTNSTNSCSQCNVLFQTQDKLAFHIGAKHKEVDLILEQKGIPIPQDRVLPAENVETRPTTSVESEPRTCAPVLSPPGSENAATPGSKDGNPPENPQSAAARTCAGVNYDLQCQVEIFVYFHSI